MESASKRRALRFLCGVLLMPHVSAAQAADSTTLLQQDFFRLINAGEPVARLFIATATLPDTTGWRHLALRAGAELQTAPADDARTVHAQWRVILQRQSPLAADCPVVAKILFEGEGIVVWEEPGLIDATLQQTAAGLRIAVLTYQTEQSDH